MRRLGESRTCRRVARLLPDLVERQVVTDLGVHRHLRTCASCQAKLRQYRSLRHLMADLPMPAGAEVGTPARTAARTVATGPVGVGRRLAGTHDAGRPAVEIALGTVLMAATAVVLGRVVRRRS